MISKICVMGTGYVGMASAIGLAELGHQVAGFDILPERVRLLQNGSTPYREAGIEEPLRRNLLTGRLAFHQDLQSAANGAEFVIVCVGTPALDDGSCDLSYIEHAIEMLQSTLDESAIVVLRSTVPPGTTEEIARKLAPIRVVYAPEFLREGSALIDFLNPDRIVIGAMDEYVAEKYALLFKQLAKPAIITGSRNAEMIKSCSNAFLALKVTFANQIANLCDGVGADALEVLRGVGADTRIGSRFLEPGIGFGGPCFEKDVKSLNQVARLHKSGNELFAATLEINNMQPKRIIALLESATNGIAGLRVGVWGAAFKAGTDDTRDSMAVRIIEALVERGAEVVAYDPEVAPEMMPNCCSVAFSALDAAKADVLLVLTEWPEFKTVDLRKISESLALKLVVDGRNIIDPVDAAAFGLRYIGIGRRAIGPVLKAVDVRQAAVPQAMAVS